MRGAQLAGATGGHLRAVELVAGLDRGRDVLHAALCLTEHSVTAALIKSFELTAGTQALDIKGIYADDDHAAVVVHETATRPDGASLAVDEVHILRLRDGKVLDLWDLPEDIQAHDDFCDGK